MFQHSGSPGGAFKAGAQMGTFNHEHASEMARSANSRRNIAQTLGGIRSLSKGPSAPVPSPSPGLSQAPGTGAGPGMGPMPGGIATPPVGGNYKAHVAHLVAATTGRHVTKNAVHSAIDRLAQKGAIGPFGAEALKLHDGPLQGPQGVNTMAAIAKEVAGGG